LQQRGHGKGYVFGFREFRLDISSLHGLVTGKDDHAKIDHCQRNQVRDGTVGRATRTVGGKDSIPVIRSQILLAYVCQWVENRPANQYDNIAGKKEGKGCQHIYLLDLNSSMADLGMEQLIHAPRLAKQRRECHWKMPEKKVLRLNIVIKYAVVKETVSPSQLTCETRKGKPWTAHTDSYSKRFTLLRQVTPVIIRQRDETAGHDQHTTGYHDQEEGLRRADHQGCTMVQCPSHTQYNTECHYTKETKTDIL
jgi:hypothetical protein